MRKGVCCTALAVLVSFSATTVEAQCAFNSGPAKGVRTTMVRVFQPCPGTPYPNLPNTQTSGLVPACTPVLPIEFLGDISRYQYDEKGGCTVQSKVRIEKDCSRLRDSDGVLLGLPMRACHVTFVKSACKGILRDGITPIDATDNGWTLATLTRATLDDAAGGDMTVIDFPVSFQYSTPKNGSMDIDSNSAQEIAVLVGVEDAAMPACSSIEIVDVTIRDPSLRPFAAPGVATRP